MVCPPVRTGRSVNLSENGGHGFSGGKKQFVWIAMGLAQDTDLFLLDEPTTFRDVHHLFEVIELVETRRDESETTIVVLHDIEQPARLAGRMIVLKDGEIRTQRVDDSSCLLGSDIIKFDAFSRRLKIDHRPRRYTRFRRTTGVAAVRSGV